MPCPGRSKICRGQILVVQFQYICKSLISLHAHVILLIGYTSCCIMQRDKLCNALMEVHRHQAGSHLGKLFGLITSIQMGHWVVNMTSAAGATLHSGTTRLVVKKRRVEAIEDCYAFIPFEGGPGQPAELCVMEVQGIASVSWQEGDEHVDPDAPMPNPDQQEAQEVQMQGEGVNWLRSCMVSKYWCQARPEPSSTFPKAISPFQVTYVYRTSE
jgi:hypothetical protein